MENLSGCFVSIYYVCLTTVISRLGQGREKALQYLRENPVICNEVEKVCVLLPLLEYYPDIYNIRIWLSSSLLHDLQFLDSFFCSLLFTLGLC